MRVEALVAILFGTSLRLSLDSISLCRPRRLPVFPAVTLKHSVETSHQPPRLLHGSAVRVSLGSGPGMAQLRLQQRAGNCDLVTLELAGRAGAAGQQSILGSRMQRAMSGRGGRASGGDSGDDDKPGSSSSSSDAAAGAQAAGGLFSLPRLLRVEVPRGGTAISGLTWRQDWRPRLKSCVSYAPSSAGRLALEVSHRVGIATQTGCLESSQPRGGGGARTLKKAGLKLAFKLPPAAKQRQSLHLGGSYEPEAGPLFDLRFQRGKKGQAQQGRASVCLRAQTRRRSYSLELECFMPI